MVCPRCECELITLTLDGGEAVYCEACAYVGVSTDFHRPPRDPPESWADAFDRFREQQP